MSQERQLKSRGDLVVKKLSSLVHIIPLPLALSPLSSLTSQTVKYIKFCIVQIFSLHTTVSFSLLGLLNGWGTFCDLLEWSPFGLSKKQALF